MGTVSGSGILPLNRLLIPVLDLRAGVVVHAVAGRRSEYRPLQSSLTTSTEPVEVLQSLRRATGLNTFYIADLDGIVNSQPDWNMLERLAATGAQLLIDTGIRSAAEIAAVRLASNIRPVVATETCEQLQEVLELGQHDVICSIDLHAGRLRLADNRLPADTTVTQLAERLWQSGLHQWIVLDTAAVGTGQGIPTLKLCRALLEQFPTIELISGGGVHSTDCLAAAEQAGLTGVLVATALHAGKFVAH
ncbi:MAG: 1-(5-phosphoribosyl)-5-[(5-phosphoribosylamino)methylideneamino] imidazole-4-carboxamide isomerase [Planctomycetota bacterium]|jgi:phosphoribosylformimino-5-aminoimidazole carboxamide ribotide isomerase